MAVYDEKDCVNKKSLDFTPEFWRFLCVIFGRAIIQALLRWFFLVVGGNVCWGKCIGEKLVASNLSEQAKRVRVYFY